MGFKTFTCVICGKEGITKPNSYAYGNGRACRCHQEVQEDFNKKKEISEEKKRQRREINERIENPAPLAKTHWREENNDPEANFMLNFYGVVDVLPFCILEALELLSSKINEVRKSHNCALMYYFNEFSKEWFKWLIFTNRAGTGYQEGVYLIFRDAVKRILDDYNTELNKINEWDVETVISVYTKLFDFAFTEIDALNEKFLSEKTDENFLAVKGKLVELSKFWSIFNGSKFATSEKVRRALAKRFSKLERLLTAATVIYIDNEE